MAEKTSRLIHTTGAAVTVDAAKVERLLAWGFTKPEAPKQPARSTTTRKK